MPWYGYDNAKKVYKLYRLSKGILSLVVDDCYSSEQIFFKDSIILNRYDSNRNYSVVRVDSDWQVTELDTGKTITESVIRDNWIYMKAVPQDGAGVYFLVFNGASLLRVTISSADIRTEDIRLEDFRVCEGRVYGILPTIISTGAYTTVNGRLYRFDESIAVKMPDDAWQLDLNLIESYNGQIYLSGSYKQGTKTRYINYMSTPDGLYTQLTGPKFDERDLQFEEARVEFGTLFLSGKRYNETGKTEDILYAQRNGVWNSALDVVGLESVTETPLGLYLKVQDYDRATPATKRDSLLYLGPDMSIVNAAIDYEISHQSVIGQALVFAGANKLTKRTGVVSHSLEYRELIPSYAVSLWEIMPGRVFTGGRQDAVDSFRLLDANGAKLLRDNFETKIVAAAKVVDQFLLYGIERDKASVWAGQKVLYFYDMKKNTYTLLTAGVDIAEILSY